jgi:predicted Ser/Thr protein kinase
METDPFDLTQWDSALIGQEEAPPTDRIGGISTRYVRRSPSTQVDPVSGVVSGPASGHGSAPVAAPSTLSPATANATDSSHHDPQLHRDPEPGQALLLFDQPGCENAGDRYHLENSIGSGGMGLVMRASQTALTRAVAVKVLRPEISKPKTLEQFQAEAHCTAYLEHPNIVPVYDAGHNFLVMKCLDGRTLSSMLAVPRAQPLTSLVMILIKVCDAVAFAHSRGIIHRDIKPDNVMVGRFGEVVLMDWGLALQINPPPDGIPRARTIKDVEVIWAGTPGYMAPEIARTDAANIGFHTDVFLLGATLYHCLTGRIPFKAKTAKEALKLSAINHFRPAGELAPTAPPKLLALCAKAMDTATDARGTVQDFSDTLQNWLLASGAEVEAARASEQGLAELARARTAGDAHALYHAYASAVAAFDHAIALAPAVRAYTEQRQEAMREYARAAHARGDRSLAALLEAGQHPVPAARETATARFVREQIFYRTPPGEVPADHQEIVRLRLESESVRLRLERHRHHLRLWLIATTFLLAATCIGIAIWLINHR